jgi:hypothetical protein
MASPYRTRHKPTLTSAQRFKYLGVAMTVLVDFNTIIHEDPRDVTVVLGEQHLLGTRFNAGGVVGGGSGQTGALGA